MYPPGGARLDPVLEDYFGPSGEPLERPVADAWTAPRWVEVEDGFVIWCFFDGSPTPGRRLVKSGPKLLEDFLDLGIADDETLSRAILRFARRWGVLNLCEHALPAMHSPDCWHRLPIRPPPRPGWLGAWKEPIEGWRIYARKALTLLRLAAKLERNQLGLRPPRQRERDGFFGSGAWVGDDDWVRFHSWPRLGSSENEQLASLDDAGRVFVGGHPVANEQVDVRDSRPEGSGDRRHLTDYRSTVAAEASAWVRLARVSPQLEWGDNKPLLHVGGASLFAALGVQVLLRIAHAEGLALCGGCPKVILHGRRVPRLDRANYCDDCRERREPQRRAKRRYRASLRQHRTA